MPPQLERPKPRLRPSASLAGKGDTDSAILAYAAPALARNPAVSEIGELRGDAMYDQWDASPITGSSVRIMRGFSRVGIGAAVLTASLGIAVTVGAQVNFTSVSDYVRRAIITQLRADGIDPLHPRPSPAAAGPTAAAAEQHASA